MNNLTRVTYQRRVFFAFLIIVATSVLVSLLTYQAAELSKNKANTAKRTADRLDDRVQENTKMINRFIIGQTGKQGQTGKGGKTGQSGKTIKGDKGDKGEKGDDGDSSVRTIEIRRTIVLQGVGPRGPQGPKGEPGVTRVVPQKCNPLLGYYCADPDDPYDGIP